MKTYQLSTKGPYGSSLKIAPLTTEEVKNQNNCFEVTGDAENPIEPESVLPDLTGFKVIHLVEKKLYDLLPILLVIQLIGNEVMNGFTCEKWEYSSSEGDKSNKYSLWLKKEVGC